MVAEDRKAHYMDSYGKDCTAAAELDHSVAAAGADADCSASFSLHLAACPAPGVYDAHSLPCLD